MKKSLFAIIIVSLFFSSCLLDDVDKLEADAPIVSTGSFVLNGSIKECYNVILFESSGLIEVFVATNDNNGSDHIDIRTNLSKLDFDNATSGGSTLVLDSGNIVVCFLMYGGIFSLDVGSFTLLVTRNEYGWYNFTSTGSLVSGDLTKTVTDVIGVDAVYHEFN